MSLDIKVRFSDGSSRFETFVQPTVSFGRAPDCDFSISETDSTTVSWNHFDLFQRNGQLFARDTGSSNGTYLNGERLEKDVAKEVVVGDLLRLGQSGPAVMIERLSPLGEEVPSQNVITPRYLIDATGLVAKLLKTHPGGNHDEIANFPLVTLIGETGIEAVGWSAVGNRNSRYVGELLLSSPSETDSVEAATMFSSFKELLQLIRNGFKDQGQTKQVEKIIIPDFWLSDPQRMSSTIGSVFENAIPVTESTLALENSRHNAGTSQVLVAFGFSQLRIYSFSRNSTSSAKGELAKLASSSFLPILNSMESYIAETVIRSTRRDPREAPDTASKVKFDALRCASKLASRNSCEIKSKYFNQELILAISRTNLSQPIGQCLSDLHNRIEDVANEMSLMPQQIQIWGDAAGYALSPEMPEIKVADVSIPVTTTNFCESLSAKKTSIDETGKSQIRPRLVFENQSTTQTTWLGNEPVVLGRGQPGEISIDEVQFPTVSGRHAQVELSGNNRFIVTDLGSRNGTFVNQKKVVGVQKLNHSDLIRLGATGPEIKYLES